jgi:hypothetical protein
LANEGNREIMGTGNVRFARLNFSPERLFGVQTPAFVPGIVSAFVRPLLNRITAMNPALTRGQNGKNPTGLTVSPTCPRSGHLQRDACHPSHPATEETPERLIE